MSLYKRKYQGKESPHWWIKLHHLGKVIRESTGTTDRKQALEVHDKLKASLWEQERLGVKPQHTWNEAAGRWLTETADKASHRDDEAKVKWLHPILGGLMLDEISLDVIARIKTARLMEGTPSTANRYLALIRSILKRAVNEWDWLGKAPKIKLFKEPEGRVRFLTPIEVQALLKELPPYLHDTVLFAFLTGLRQSNVLGLEWSKVQLDKAHVWVDAPHAKGRKAIAVPLNGDALALLIKQKGKHPTRVFTNAGKPIANVNNRVWRKALKRASITDFRWHDSRHTWASHHVMNGTQPFELQKLGGWRSAKMVERYAHLSSEHLAGAAARLDSVFVARHEMGTEA
jgi:integrase